MSPLRQSVPWIIFGPLLVSGGALAVFGAGEAERTGGSTLLVVFLAVALGMHALIRRARLELDAEGVRLRQIGFDLRVPWSRIAELSLERGREGFLTREPIDGDGAARLAGLRRFGFLGAPMYSSDQQAAMAGRRWIPIEPFAWALRRGSLAADIARFAPDVPASTPPATSPATQAKGFGTAALVIGLSLAVAALVAMSPAWWRSFIGVALAAVLASLLTLRAILSARNGFRGRSRVAGMLFSLLALLLALLAVAAWGGLVDLLREPGRGSP